MWQTASNAPFDCDLELAVIDADGQHALVFPCRRISAGWINASTKERLDVRPTHWRPWADKRWRLLAHCIRQFGAADFGLFLGQQT